MRGKAGLGQGELARLPKLNKLLQTAKNARQAGHDEGVDGGGNPGTLLLYLHSTVQAGDLVAEGG